MKEFNEEMSRRKEERIKNPEKQSKKRERTLLSQFGADDKSEEKLPKKVSKRTADWEKSSVTENYEKFI